MDTWIIYYEDGSQDHRSGSREEIAEHLARKYPDFHVEEYTDQVLVWSSKDVVDCLNVEPIASAVPD